MPKKFPPEFKRDVVRVARRGDLTHAEVASDFDISVESVRRWVRQADVDDDIVLGQTSRHSLLRPWSGGATKVRLRDGCADRARAMARPLRHRWCSPPAVGERRRDLRHEEGC